MKQLLTMTGLFCLFIMIVTTLQIAALGRPIPFSNFSVSEWIVQIAAWIFILWLAACISQEKS